VSIAIPEATYVRICAAARWLDPPERALLYQDVVEALHGCELGDGAVSRAIDVAFRARYRAPLEADEKYAPRHMAARRAR
jgi:hypothetical protein